MGVGEDLHLDVTGPRQVALDVTLRTSEVTLGLAPRALDQSSHCTLLATSRVHWVRPELVAEVKFLTWTDDNLLRQVVYEGLREDKPASEVRRSVPHR